MRRSMVLGAALVLFGCGADGVIGEWENEANPNDELSLFAEGGYRTFEQSAVTSDGTPITLEIAYEVDWVRVGSGQYDLEFECSTATLTFDGSSVYGCVDVAQLFEVATWSYEAECEWDEARDEQPHQAGDPQRVQEAKATAGAGDRDRHASLRESGPPSGSARCPAPSRTAGSGRPR